MPKVGMEPIRRTALVASHDRRDRGKAGQPGRDCRANRQTGGDVDGIGASLLWRQRPDLPRGDAPHFARIRGRGACTGLQHAAPTPYARAEAIIQAAVFRAIVL